MVALDLNSESATVLRANGSNEPRAAATMIAQTAGRVGSIWR